MTVWTREEIAQLEASLDRRERAAYWARMMFDRPEHSERRKQAKVRANAAKGARL